MAAETLLRQVEEKRKKDISKLDTEYSGKIEQIKKLLQVEISNISNNAKAQAAALSQREKVRIEGAGKLQAKKVIFDATESMLKDNLSAIKDAFGRYASTKEYGELLPRMVSYASSRLGGGIKLVCRKADVPILTKTGSILVSSDLISIGGFKAVSGDGNLELDLTFEELLRNHQEEVRAVVLSRRDQ